LQLTLLGLTATPNRADSADILGLFDDFTAYRADIARGIELGRLVPFHYFGVKDDIDYDHIPWRNKRFDPQALARAAQTEARMQTLWRAWGDHRAARTLVFCCSIEHAKFVRGWLEDKGVRVAAVFSGEDSDDRESVLAELERGERDAVCAVDIFNEGVDLPSIDRVAMLRPTESSVVFLQQLGRGLRASAGKDALTVIDFAGNHRIFLERVRALLSIAGATAAANLRGFLESTEPEQLPAGW
jgi:superfamily II DNA or RNA helicase